MMNSNFLSKGIFIMALLTMMSGKGFALIGGQNGNGGDICENRFKTVRDDLQVWLNKGGGTKLTLPAGLSFESYKSKMVEQLQKARISCTDSTLQVANLEKTCKNFIDSKGQSQIICHTKRFAQTSESDQYILVHHEYAGLAGFEINNGDGSQYTISNQISGYLENQVVKKLVIKNPLTPLPAPTNNERVPNIYPTSCSQVNLEVLVKRAAVVLARDIQKDLLRHGPKVHTTIVRADANLMGIVKQQPQASNGFYHFIANLDIELIADNGTLLLLRFNQGDGRKVTFWATPRFKQTADSLGNVLTSSADCEINIQVDRAEVMNKHSQITVRDYANDSLFPEGWPINPFVNGSTIN